MPAAGHQHVVLEDRGVRLVALAAAAGGAGLAGLAVPVAAATPPVAAAAVAVLVVAVRGLLAGAAGPGAGWPWLRSLASPWLRSCWLPLPALVAVLAWSFVLRPWLRSCWLPRPPWLRSCGRSCGAVLLARSWGSRSGCSSRRFSDDARRWLLLRLPAAVRLGLLGWALSGWACSVAAARSHRLRLPSRPDRPGGSAGPGQRLLVAGLAGPPDWAALIASISCAFFIEPAPEMPMPPAIAFRSASSMELSPPPRFLAEARRQRWWVRWCPSRGGPSHVSVPVRPQPSASGHCLLDRRACSATTTTGGVRRGDRT